MGGVGERLLLSGKYTISGKYVRKRLCSWVHHGCHWDVHCPSSVGPLTGQWLYSHFAQGGNAVFCCSSQGNAAWWSFISANIISSLRKIVLSPRGLPHRTHPLRNSPYTLSIKSLEPLGPLGNSPFNPAPTSTPISSLLRTPGENFPHP